jgi:hypothetical protein
MTENENGDPKKSNEAVHTWLAAARAELDGDDGGNRDEKKEEANNHNQNTGNSTSSSSNISTTPTSSNMTTIEIRQKFGNTLSTISDTINSNLIIVRYVTLSSVLLLGAYGVVNTPLFFRYKRISELPIRVFSKRHWLHGRIVGVINSSIVQDTANTTTAAACPIVILFRHYSPIERLVGRPLFTNATTSAFGAVGGGGGGGGMSVASQISHNTRNLLRIELAGITGPPTTISTSQSSRNKNSLLSPSLTAGTVFTPPTTATTTFPLLNEIIQQDLKVSLQLLAVVQRCVKTPSINNSSNNHNFNTLLLSPAAVDDESDKTTVICHLHYPESNQWFTTTNVSLQLVRLGQAMLTPGSGSLVRAGVPSPLSSSESSSSSSSSKRNVPNNGSLTNIIINYNPTVQQLQKDTKFISQLEEAEYTSWKDKVGIWSNDKLRQQLRKEYVEEEERMNKSWWMVVKKSWQKMMMMMRTKSSSQK